MSNKDKLYYELIIYDHTKNQNHSNSYFSKSKKIKQYLIRRVDLVKNTPAYNLQKQSMELADLVVQDGDDLILILKECLEREMPQIIRIFMSMENKIKESEMKY